MKTPTKVPVKMAIQNMYDEVALSKDQLEHLRQLETDIRVKKDKPSRSVFRLSPLLRVAVFSNVILVGFLTWFVFDHYWASNNTDQIIADVIDNHLSYKAMKYQTHSLAELGH